MPSVRVLFCRARFVIAVLLLACAASTAPGQGQTLQILLLHDEIDRNYTIYVPTSYVPQHPAPLVVNMHGYTLNRSFQMAASRMNDVADREGFLVVYPDAINSNWYGSQDNIDFIDSLLDDIQTP